MRAGGRPVGRGAGGVRGRRRPGRRQAGGTRRASGRGAHDRHARARPARPHPEIAAVGDPARPGIVHRLDKDTSGLLLVARTRRRVSLADEAAEGADHRAALPRPRVGTARRATRGRSTRRSVVRRAPDADDGVDARAGGPNGLRGRRGVHRPGGRVVACTARSTPGARTRSVSISPPSAIRSSATTGTADAGEPLTDLDRFFLHAGHLGVRPPATGERIELDSPLPPDLAAARDRFSVSQVPATAARRGP